MNRNTGSDWTDWWTDKSTGIVRVSYFSVRIRVRGLGSGTDIGTLAQQIVAKCNNLVHPAKLPEVEQLLYYLQNRKDTMKSTPGECL